MEIKKAYYDYSQEIPHIYPTLLTSHSIFPYIG
jgi:hypothetical protein